MNESEDTDSVAVLLTCIRPVAPSAELMERLLAARTVATAPPANSRIIPFLPRLAAAAAVFAITGTAVWFSFPAVEPQRTAQTPPPATATGSAAVQFRAPLRSSQKLLGVRDLGVARDSQSRPVRLMHATWLDDDLYDKGDGSEPLRESRVRDEIVPVVLTTY